MALYLILAVHLAGIAASSVYFADVVRGIGGYPSLAGMDREDWLTVGVMSTLWPLSWAVILWKWAYQAMQRRRYLRLMRELGATTTEEDRTNV